MGSLKPIANFLGAACVAAVCCVTSAAHASDAAELNILGFSDDQRYFAFEQFGIQDGSGFAYSDVFVVDLRNDTWVSGGPIHEQAKEETNELADIRNAALKKYDALKKTYAISAPAQLLARNAVTEVIADRKTMSFDRWHLSSEFGSTPVVFDSQKETRFNLRLAEKPLPAPASCPKDMGDMQGFDLHLSGQSIAEHVVFSDDKLPASRGCPLGYDIQAIVAGYGYDAPNKLVAIIGVYSIGFEGKDLRYMAVPVNTAAE